MESLRLFTHAPVKLTEVISGERLERLIVAYERGLVLVPKPVDEAQSPKRPKSSDIPQLAVDLRTRAYPRGGSDFTKDAESGQWTRERVYTMPKSRGDCRFYNDMLLSMSRLEREWITPFTAHLDVVNCYYSVLATLIDRIYPDGNGPNLYRRIYEYADNREPFFDAMDRLVSPAKLEWKTMFLAMISQKSAVGWLKDHGFHGVRLPPQVFELESQLDALRQMLVQSQLGQSFLGFGNAGLDEWGITNKIVTRVLSAIQTEQMLILIKCLETQGHPVSMWIHDAVEVGEIDSSDDDTCQSFLARLRPHLDEAGFSSHLHLQFKSKAATVRMVADALKPFEETDEPSTDWLHYNYDQLKAMVEKRDWANNGYGLTKILSGGYIVCRRVGNEDGEPGPVLITAQEVTEMCRHFPSVPHPEKKTKRMSFIERLLSDPEIQRKDSVDCVFRDSICHRNIYNLYEGMPAERWDPLSDYEAKDPHLQSLYDNFVGHLGDLMDDDDHVRWALDFFAHMFQFPSTKPGVALVFHSAVQGVGKNLALSIIAAALGPKYSAETAKPAETLFGQFNAMLDNKVMVVINETPVSQAHLIEIFKDHITSPKDVIRNLHRAGIEKNSRVRYVITTNSENFTHLSNNERRFQVSSARARTLLVGPRKDMLLEMLGNKRALRFLYESLMSRQVQDGALHNFCTSRVKSRVYLNNQARHRTPYAQFITEFIDNYEAPSATSSSFIPPSASSSSTPPPPPPRPTTIVITNERMYEHYKEFCKRVGLDSTSVHGIPLPTENAFNANLASELEVTLNSQDVSPFGVSYYKHTKAPNYNKRAWTINLDVCRSKLEEKYPTLV